MRAAASLDTATRLRTIFVAADNRDALTVGEFLTVEVEGTVTPNAYRVPTTALTSRDQLWVVADGRLEQRTVDVLGREGDLTTVRVFDAAEGVVALPPSDGRSGLPVDARPQTSLAAASVPIVAGD